ncbi:glycosyltransferase [Hydrogenophaga pseudoflava]|uniref:glycosyltransferase n=1 Tax=Hydrogenophaga pseudoflava TaxID=47421 RepID=UPI0027E497D3|nr:glycosyltransferase [Hydrogenophaga pseudoflava]MDQ7747038.1 glycosyltransferase [Hydrogenophaga pseudoflava]
MKVAIVHYWWLSNRGGEAVVAAIAELYPEADLFVHVCDEALVRKTLGTGFRGRVITTFIARLPGAARHYQKYLPLMPVALEQLDLSAYDLVISSESGPAKGVVTRPDALHVCYCHSPMRYVWDMYPSYLQGAGRLVRALFPWVAHWLRVWDRASADRVDHFVANSSFVASRIRKFYRRPAEVVYPPVNVTAFDHRRERGDFYLCLGQLVAYKRADMVVDVFNRLGLPLVVIGEGELLDRLRAVAGPNVQLMGRQAFGVVKEKLETCKALVFPGLEDFGIVPVEAMASGAPVIAYGKGGALDTIVHGKTGLLFDEQSPEALEAAVRGFEAGHHRFDVGVLREHAAGFDKSVFQHRFLRAVEGALALHRAAPQTPAEGWG